jgi:23S rRNA (cytidine1920-2'-O)/16S rRNA (cytidine1409-2'-O)-methyltransferase
VSESTKPGGGSKENRVHDVSVDTGAGRGGKERLDVLVLERGLAESRQRAQALILAGQVLVNGQPATKAGIRIERSAELTLAEPDIPYVSRGGLKLEAALDAFGIDPAGKLALDVGSSTGGFTDCLLQRGARKVVAVDVGRHQMHEKLRGDPRVELHEKTNARNLPPDFLPEPADLISVDLSFISIEKVLGALRPLLASGGSVIALVKPQFEAGPKEVPKGGVIRDPAVHQRVLEKVAADFERNGFQVRQTIPSPVRGGDGNREFLLWASLT